MSDLAPDVLALADTALLEAADRQRELVVLADGLHHVWVHRQQLSRAVPVPVVYATLATMAAQAHTDLRLRGLEANGWPTAACRLVPGSVADQRPMTLELHLLTPALPRDCNC